MNQMERADGKKEEDARDKNNSGTKKGKKGARQTTMKGNRRGTSRHKIIVKNKKRTDQDITKRKRQRKTKRRVFTNLKKGKKRKN